jgi:hypothetical protein
VSEQIDQPVADTPAPALEPVAETPVPEPQAAPAQPADPEAEFDAAVEASAIDVPDGDRLVPLVPLSAVTKLREKLRTVKQQQAVPDPALVQRLEQAEARAREAEPLAQAFRAIQNSQPQQQAQPVQQPVEDMSELSEIAKDFDFYKPDGTPDLEKAKRHQDRVVRTAQTIAERQTAPLVQHTLSGEAQRNRARAQATVHPVTKQSADPAILDSLISHVAKQEGGLATLANPETMKQIWLNAYALTTLRAESAPAVQPDRRETPVPPVVTERSGGGNAGQPKGLSVAEKRAAKEAGMTEKQYLEVASGMKW